MLHPHEFTVGPISEVGNLTLVLPRNGYEHAYLVAPSGEGLHAVYLSGDHVYSSFDCQGNTALEGLLIPDVAIEVDPDSLFDPNDGRSPLGAIIRTGQILGVASINVDPRSFQRRLTVPLQTALPSLPPQMSAGFHSWAITLGRGLERRELFKVDVGRRAESVTTS